MSISKIKKLKLETTAEYQPLSNLNVQFYNRDINTSVLNFIVTRNNSPLLLGDANVDTSIILVAEDGSKIRDELVITDGMNGIIQYTIPSEFLKHTGKVTGQVEIAIKGKEDTVVERLFSFNIAESLVESFGADTKLVYIKKFDDLEIRIDNQMTKIEEAMANGTDYVTELEQAREKGLTDIEIAKTDSVKALNDLADKRLGEINSKASEYSSKFDDDKQYMDDKHQAFKESVLNSGVVTQGESKEWQKYKLTNDDGTVKDFERGMDLEDEDFLDSLSAGFYYLPSPINPPVGYSGFLTVYERHAVKVIYFQPYNQDKLSINRYYQKWSGWKELTNTQTDTGWLNVMLKNDVNTESTVMYKIVTMNGMKQVSIKGEVFNVPENTEINFGKVPNIETIGTPYIINTFPSDIKMWIENDGEMKVLAPVEWNSEDVINFSATFIL